MFLRADGGSWHGGVLAVDLYTHTDTRQSSFTKKITRGYLQCVSNTNTKQHQVTLFILGEMFGWGNTVNGELGLGGIEEEQILSPRELKFSKATQVQQVACGTNHTAVVTNDGQVYTCGSNDYSQLGHNKPRKRLEQVDGLSAYVINNVACGLAHSVAVNEWGQVFSWGSNVYGQLGLDLHKICIFRMEAKKIKNPLRTGALTSSRWLKL
uniref:Uncharacterized protein n=1 Tax=Timema poppense TaxID=170557 RepID=A0A7R9DK77_TIMPO|nr:unnamed protein product [Timema poppensis]